MPTGGSGKRVSIFEDEHTAPIDSETQDQGGARQDAVGVPAVTTSGGNPAAPPTPAKDPRATTPKPKPASQADQLSASGALSSRGEVVDALSHCGSVGVLVVQLGPLEMIESRFGAAAYRTAVGRCADVVRRVVGDHLRPHDVISHSANGSDDLVAHFFRARADGRFYRLVLPRLCEELRAELGRRAGKIAYPFIRPAPVLAAGYGVAPHNPGIRADRSLRAALHQAHEDADATLRQQRLKEERELAHIIVAEDIRSVFEPIVELRSGRIFGLEALSRGPERGDWSYPAKLFGVAGKAGFVFELDCLCRRTALRSVAGALPAGYSLFLNCLPSAIRDPGFSGPQLAETLGACGLSPQRIVLEVSEQESIENQSIFHEAVDYYRSLGTRIALDDVGSGYASLSSVLDVRPDVVKIDLGLIRSIDRDPARQELVRTIAQLAARIGAVAVAEGIETAEEFQTVRGVGVTFGQGYLFSRPQSIESIPTDESLQTLVAGL